MAAAGRPPRPLDKHADRLVGRKQRLDVAIDAAQKLHQLRVLEHAEAEPAVLARDLEPESAELAQAVEDVRDLTGPLAEGRAV